MNVICTGKRSITLKINGRERYFEVKPNEILLNVLRERFDLMGSKYGCGIGECGACTVLLNGRAVLSCQILAISVAGQEITTIEGISNGTSHPKGTLPRAGRPVRAPSASHSPPCGDSACWDCACRHFAPFAGGLY